VYVNFDGFIVSLEDVENAPSNVLLICLLLTLHSLTHYSGII